MRILVTSNVPRKDTSPRPVYSTCGEQDISWNIQAPNAVLAVPQFLYLCHVYSFSAYCSSENSRSSNAVLQVGLNKENGTHHNLFSLHLYFAPSCLASRREKIACPTLLKGLQCSPSSMVTEPASILSTRRTKFATFLLRVFQFAYS